MSDKVTPQKLHKLADHLALVFGRDSGEMMKILYDVFQADQQSAPAPVETVGDFGEPWRWRVSKATHHVVLFDSHGNIVMDFVRWGFGGAQPRFNVNGIMKTASELAVIKDGAEHHSTWDQDIDNDTARLIASVPARSDMETALAAKEDRVRVLEDVVIQLRCQKAGDKLVIGTRGDRIAKFKDEIAALRAENEKLRGVVEAGANLRSDYARAFSLLEEILSTFDNSIGREPLRQVLQSAKRFISGRGISITDPTALLKGAR